jgi:hypothetical protein
MKNFLGKPLDTSSGWRSGGILLEIDLDIGTIDEEDF